MEFAELKSTFLKSVVEHAYTTIEEIPENVKIGIPNRLVEKWIGQMNTVNSLTCIPQNPRLVNRFTVGADPEYSLLDPLTSSLVPAMKLGLNTGLAFGMDMNGRLVELRPRPSRFILDIIASMLAELRWMAVTFPSSLEYSWLSTPWDGQDGIGGHVHLARRRGAIERDRDISTFDTLNMSLMLLGVFNDKLNDYRRAKTKYGHYGDFRPQRYGYEYRSFPTWMDSPWMAYLVLVLSKLTVYEPKLILNIYKNSERKAKFLEKAISNLLAYYKNVDDDAWIAFNALKKWGLPKQQGAGDFKVEWGIVFPQPNKMPVSYYPSIIEGTENERQAVFNYLVNKEAIRPDLPVCNWEPKELPKGYIWNMSFTQTYHKMGVGEIVHDLACHRSMRIEITSSDQAKIIQYEEGKYDFSKGLQEITKIFPNMKLARTNVGNDVKHLRICLPQSLRQYNTIQQVRKVLTSGLFPIWNVKDVKEGCFEDWVRKNEVKQNVKYIGKELTL